MKTFVLIFVIFSVLGASFVRGFDKKAAVADFMAKTDACKGEVGAKESDVAELVAKQPASTTEGKCLRACLMKKYEVMDASGKFAKAVALKHVETYTDGDAGKMKTGSEIIDACAGLSVPSDPCEAADQYCKCFKEQAVAHGITDFQF